MITGCFAPFFIQKRYSMKSLQPFCAGFQYPSADEIKQLIQKSNFTGAQIADLLGVNSRYVRAIQNGTERIKYSEWVLLCAYAGLIKIDKLQNGPKCFVTLFIENGRLCASCDDRERAQVIGTSTISIPFFIDDINAYINDITQQAAQAEEPIKEFGKLAKAQFEKSGGLSVLFNKK